MLVERNNHGHAVILALREMGAHVLFGRDGKAGFLTTGASKALLYDDLAQAVREQALTICDGETAMQLASVDALTLRAPTGMQDDRAMALALAWRAVEQGVYEAVGPIRPVDDF